MIVACVLRTGGDYDVEYVRHLRAAVQRYLPLDHRFVCLTDVELCDVPGVEWYVMLRSGWGRWWPKIELFRPGLFPARETVLYLDLDTVLVDDISTFAAYSGAFAVLADLYRPDKMIGSGMMIFRGDAPARRAVWEDFTKDPEGTIRRHPHRMDNYLRNHLHSADRIQDLWPGAVVSYKKHCRPRRGGPATVPPGSRVVCFHGRPRPRDVPADDPFHTLWRGEDG